MDFEDETDEALQDLKKQEAQIKQASTYMIRPNFLKKFKKGPVQEYMSEVLLDLLHDKMYDPEEVPGLIENISNQIKKKVKEMKFERYKLVVQCVIGEHRGQAVKMACSCFWDSDTDNYAQSVYVNNSLFCVVAAFGIYFY